MGLIGWLWQSSFLPPLPCLWSGDVLRAILQSFLDESLEGVVELDIAGVGSVLHSPNQLLDVHAQWLVAVVACIDGQRVSRFFGVDLLNLS